MMMTMRLPILVTLLLLACGSGNAPDVSSADLTGIATRVEETMIMVEEKPEESSGSAKAAVTITSETKIESLSGRTPELRKGQRVSVWFNGPVAESYPMRGTARRVVIHD